MIDKEKGNENNNNDNNQKDKEFGDFDVKGELSYEPTEPGHPELFTTVNNKAVNTDMYVLVPE